MTTARVAVVGAGPGGLAATSRLGERAGEHLEVLLFQKGATAEYLPETSPGFWARLPGRGGAGGSTREAQGCDSGRWRRFRAAA